MAKRVFRIISWTLLALTVVSILLLLRKPSFPTIETSPEAVRSFDEKLSQISALSPTGAPRELHFTETELNSKFQESLKSPPGGGPATLKAAALHLEGDKLIGLLTVEVSGVDIYLTLGGTLGVNQRTLEFTPTDLKVGSHPLPVSMVGSALRHRLHAMRDQMQLPEAVQDVRVENGELVVRLR